MPKVDFTAALNRFFPELKKEEFGGGTIRELLSSIEQKYPGINSYLIDEEGKLRKHINIFIGDRMIEDRQDLSDQVNSDQEVLIFQALSGG